MKGGRGSKQKVDDDAEIKTQLQPFTYCLLATQQQQQPQREEQQILQQKV